MKKLLAALIGLLLVAGCGSSPTGGAAAQTTADLSGTWKQTNSNTSDSYQEAVINGQVIEINWVSDGGDTRALYWAGTYTAPTQPVNTFEWESKNDHDKTGSAILASSDDTKKFTYADGILSWPASAMGVDMVIKAERR